MPLSVPTDISGLLTKAWFDQIIGDPSPETIVSILELLHTGDAVFGNSTMNGSEKILGGFSGAPVLSWAEGYIDLSNMMAGDTIVIREYVAITVDGAPNYRLYATHSYSGAQAEPLVHFTSKIQSQGWRVTAQQTAGTNRIVPFYFESKYLG